MDPICIYSSIARLWHSLNLTLPFDNLCFAIIRLFLVSGTVALISQSEPGCASHEVTEIEPIGENLILEVSEESLAANLEAGKQAPEDQFTFVVPENESTVLVDRAHHTVIKLLDNGDASMESESNESTISSSETTVGNSPHHCHVGKLHRRRTPKIRLLTELLGENGNMNAKHVESSTSNGTPKTSLQADVRYASKCQETYIEENISHSYQKKERNVFRNGKFRHQEIPSSSNVDKQIQTWRGEIKGSVSSLGTENGLSAGIKKNMNGLWSSCKMDRIRNNSLRKKRSKKFQEVDPHSVSLMPSKDKDQYEILPATEYRSVEALDSAPILAHHNEFLSRTPHSISSNVMESNVFPWNSGMIIRKRSVAQKDVETMKRTVHDPFRYEKYENNERELHLSLNNYSNPPRDHKRIRRLGENELPTFRSEQYDTSKVSKLNDIKTSSLGDQNHPHQASDVFYGQGAHSVLNNKMANSRMPLPRPSAEPHTDNSWLQLQQKVCFSIFMVVAKKK